MKLAVVGAGVAGLAAARRLRTQPPRFEVVVYEQGAQAGGRTATRRVHGAVIDHGAQYVKTPTPDLQRLLCQELGHETLVDIGLPVWCFDGSGSIVEGDPEQNADPKWTYSDGLDRLAWELSKGLDVRFDAPVARFEWTGEAYRLDGPDGGQLDVVDALLLTPPAPRTAELIGASDLPSAARDTLLDQLARVSYRQCISIALGYPPELGPRPWYALVNTDRRHPISWVAYEHCKPGRFASGQHVVIAQMAPGWSAENWNVPAAEANARVADLLSDLLGEGLWSPRWADHQAWRHALPDGSADFEVLNGAQPGLFLAGDFTAGQGRVHLAIEQGWRAAQVMAECL